MKNDDRQPMKRDRTYKQIEVNGDYITHRQYVVISITLLVTHFCLEFFYLWVGCTPMVIINIFSFLSYIVSISFVLKGNTYITVWIMIFEVYLHVIFACIFMGMRCGYQLWLFGTLSCIFLPFFLPDIKGSLRWQIGSFSVLIIATFMVLTALDSHGYMPTRFNAPLEVARVMYYVNAFLGFWSIMIYAGAYNARMADKNNELQKSAEHDFLTGIYNRQRMQKILDAEISIVRDMDENHLMVAIADIDFFKKINDTYGHDVGDEALKELAKIFSRYMDIGLLYGRWGGEEFLLIAPESMKYDEFAVMLENIRLQVEENSFLVGDQRISFTISIGASAYEKGMTSEQLVNLADDRLYHAKETGRNKVVY